MDDAEAKKDAGNGYTATALLQGKDSGNYVLPTSYTTTFDIEQLTAELKWGQTSFEYDGMEHVPTVTVSRGTKSFIEQLRQAQNIENKS